MNQALKDSVLSGFVETSIPIEDLILVCKSLEYLQADLIENGPTFWSFKKMPFKI